MILFIYAFCGLILGSVCGYYFAKSRLGKTVGQLESTLTNQQNLHSQTKQSLSEIQERHSRQSGELQEEQKQRVKYETMTSEMRKQLDDMKLENEEAKQILTRKNEEIVTAQSMRTRAETELREAHSTILQLELLKKNIEKLQTDNTSLSTINADLTARYEQALKAVDEQKKFIQDSNQALRESFNSLSAEVLKSNNQSFLDLAKTAFEKHMNLSKGDMDKRQQAIDTLVKPLGESLQKFEKNIQEIEKSRQGAYSEIKVFLDNMKGTAEKLQKETNTLVSALKTSNVRGRYGEIGLRRVVEFSGMSQFCDFDEQESKTTDMGDRLRPDLIVNLPGKRRIIVDSKVPLASYLQIFETNDDAQKKELLRKHAIAVRSHFKKLSEKAYWSQFDDTADYVIMYMQIESSFGAALEEDRTLIEDGINNRIIFATPTTLITLLKTVAFSWQQLKMSENIYQIRDAGIELYNRVTLLIQYINTMGGSLNSAVQNYNKVIGSLESRFMPQVKKLKEIGGSLMEKEIPEVNRIDTSIRPVNQMALPLENPQGSME